MTSANTGFVSQYRTNDHKYGSSIRKQKKAAIKAKNKKRHRRACRA